MSATSHFAPRAETQAAGRLLEYNAQLTPRGLTPRRIRIEDPWKVIRHGAEARYHGDCVSPVALQLESNWLKWSGDDRRAFNCAMSVRCRKCPQCMDQSARCWTARAYQELQRSHRTWFCTLTFAPKSYPGPSGPTPLEFARRQFTLFAKRLRKNGGSFRYLAVLELHRSGMPHIHCLLHEAVPGGLKWSMVDKEWRELGFHKTKLAKSDFPVSYLTKYLFKRSPVSRVRASINYGSCTDRHVYALRPSERSEREEGVTTVPHQNNKTIPTQTQKSPPATEAIRGPPDLWCLWLTVPRDG